MLDWDDLKTFLAIARRGSLSAGARTLKVSQTTMGRRLDRLHDGAGATLLERTPTGYRLTQAGAAILAQVERMEEAALSIERTISGEDQRLEGMVRVTAVEAFAAHILAPGIADLHALHPGIVIEFITDDRSLSLARREADIAVRLGRFEAHETVVRKIGDMAFAAYASADYLTRHGSPGWESQASGHRLVRVQDDLLDTPDGRWITQCARAADAVLLANSREVQVRAVEAGVGIGFLPRYIADPRKTLIRLPDPVPIAREIWMGVHRDTRLAPRIIAVQNAIVEIVKRAKAVLVPE